MGANYCYVSLVSILVDEYRPIIDALGELGVFEIRLLVLCRVLGLVEFLTFYPAD